MSIACTVIIIRQRVSAHPHCKAESVIPPLCQQTLTALLPAALPHTASSGLSGTYANCPGLVWSSWQPAGGGWPGGTQLFASVFLDHFDVWPRAKIDHIMGVVSLSRASFVPDVMASDYLTKSDIL